MSRDELRTALRTTTDPAERQAIRAQLREIAYANMPTAAQEQARYGRIMRRAARNGNA